MMIDGDQHKSQPLLRLSFLATHPRALDPLGLIDLIGVLSWGPVSLSVAEVSPRLSPTHA